MPPGFARAVVALGNFDGLHRGHRAVIGEAQRLAAALGLPAGLLSFEPHPRSFFKPDAPLFRLTPAPLKAALACAMGLQGLVELPFNHALAGTSAHDFIEEMLVRCLGIGGIVIGHDFHFGKGRAGSPEMIAEMGARLGVPVSVVAALKEGEAPVSSSQIRDCLVQGDVEAAAHLLGYRCNPQDDTLVLPNRGGGQGSQYGERKNDSALLIDATRKRLMPPLALPKKEFMEEALGIWNELGLPAVKVPSPWHGYELGNWGDDWTQFAKNAVEGNWEANGLQTLARQRSGLGAETAVRSVEK